MLKDNMNFSKPIISRKKMAKIWCGNFEKSFLEWEKRLQTVPALPPRKFFHVFFIIISIHTVFLVQFVINLHLRVYQKPEIALAKAARGVSAF